MDRYEGSTHHRGNPYGEALSLASDMEPSAANQQYSLRWNNHQSHLMSAFGALLQNESLVDCTIVCEDSAVRAHRVVLSACSSYFQTIFTENPGKHPIVVLKDVHCWEMQSILDFIYKGETHVPERDLTRLIKAAENLKIRGLTSNEQQHLMDGLHIGTTNSSCSPANLSASSTASSPGVSGYMTSGQNGGHHSHHSGAYASLSRSPGPISTTIRRLSNSHHHHSNRHQDESSRRDDLQNEGSGEARDYSPSHSPSSGYNSLLNQHRSRPRYSSSSDHKTTGVEESISLTTHLLQHAAERERTRSVSPGGGSANDRGSGGGNAGAGGNNGSCPRRKQARPRRRSGESVTSSLDLSKGGSPLTPPATGYTLRGKSPGSVGAGDDHPENLSLRRSTTPSPTLSHSGGHSATSPFSLPPSTTANNSGDHHDDEHQRRSASTPGGTLTSPLAINLVKMEQLMDADRKPPLLDRHNIAGGDHDRQSDTKPMITGTDDGIGLMDGRHSAGPQPIPGPSRLSNGFGHHVHDQEALSALNYMASGGGMAHPLLPPPSAPNGGSLGHGGVSGPLHFPGIQPPSLHGPSGKMSGSGSGFHGGRGSKGQHSAPRGGPPRAWSNEDLTRALDNVWNKRMTTSQASRCFGIPYNSLLMYVRGKYGKSLRLDVLKQNTPAANDNLNTIGNSRSTPKEKGSKGKDKEKAGGPSGWRDRNRPRRSSAGTAHRNLASATVTSGALAAASIPSSSSSSAAAAAAAINPFVFGDVNVAAGIPPFSNGLLPFPAPGAAALSDPSLGLLGLGMQQGGMRKRLGLTGKFALWDQDEKADARMREVFSSFAQSRGRLPSADMPPLGHPLFPPPPSASAPPSTSAAGAGISASEHFPRPPSLVGPAAASMGIPQAATLAEVEERARQMGGLASLLMRAHQAAASTSLLNLRDGTAAAAEETAGAKSGSDSKMDTAVPSPKDADGQDGDKSSSEVIDVDSDDNGPKKMRRLSSDGDAVEEEFARVRSMLLMNSDSASELQANEDVPDLDVQSVNEISFARDVEEGEEEEGAGDEEEEEEDGGRIIERNEVSSTIAIQPLDQVEEASSSPTSNDQGNQNRPASSKSELGGLAKNGPPPSEISAQ